MGTLTRATKFIAFVLLTLIATSACHAQANSTSPTPKPDVFAEQLSKYPGLLPALAQLLEKLKHEVQFPPDRSQSQLLPLLPAATTYYIAFPNYGEAAHQALAIFREQQKQNSALRDSWQQGNLAKTEPQLEDFVEKFYALSQYLGDEMVVSGAVEKTNPTLLLIAEVRKPGLKNYLQQLVTASPNNLHANLRILDPQELSDAKPSNKPGEFVVLVRPDFVIMGPGLETVRQFNSILDKKHGEFASSPLGQRIQQSYHGGASIVAGADLRSILSQIPAGTPANQKVLDESGFKDLTYLVWNRKTSADESVSEMELDFAGSRHGIASWLAAPSALSGLDFVSPKSPFVLAMGLRNLGDIFDDLKEISTASNPKAFAQVTVMEQAMHISLRDDLFAQLQGEIIVEAKSLDESKPDWNLILRVNDADRLQKTLAKLLVTLPLQPHEFQDNGITYHSLTVPSGQKPLQIVYTFAHGHMIISSSRETAGDALARYESGDTLPKSAQFLASIPPGYSPRASAFLYEDAAAMNAFRLRHLPPEMAKVASQFETDAKPVLFCAYGEPDAIRTVSAGTGADASAVLIGAAIAMPNLIRARTAANESSAVATLRTLNVAQIAYSAAYPDKGFASGIATLGPDPADPAAHSQDHANLIDAKLGASCMQDSWCSKDGYRFSLKPVCITGQCANYVAVATPISSGTGTRNLCSTSDGVIRFNVGPALSAPVSVSECRKWSKLP